MSTCVKLIFYICLTYKKSTNVQPIKIAHVFNTCIIHM